MEPSSTLTLPDGSTLDDLSFSHSDHGRKDGPLSASHGAPSTYQLEFLAPVILSQIPLYMAISSAMDVTPDSQTEKWLRQSLIDAGMALLEPYGGCVNDAVKEVGVLARVVGCGTGTGMAEEDGGGEMVEAFPATEVVFFMHDSSDGGKSTVKAIALSSHLLYAAASLPSPPETVADDDEPREARFLELPAVAPNALPRPSQGEDAVVPEAPLEGTASLKRNSQDIDQLFESAVERRKKTRRKGGAGIGLAASGGSDSSKVSASSTSVPAVNVLQGRHRRRESVQAMQPPTAQDRSDPRPAAGTRPPSRPGPPRQRSSLSRMTSADELPQDGETSFSERNKSNISKTVMAGMRIFGLHRGASSTNESQQKGPSFEESQTVGDGAIIEDEYKLVYHQTFKGTVFAFRKELEKEVLRPDAVREVVDRLLGVFCGEAG